MHQRIVIIGAGFAGMWSALAARRRLEIEGVHDDDIDVVVVSPRPMLVMRPRLYESNAHAMETPLTPLFEAAGIKYIQGEVRAIRADRDMVEIARGDGETIELRYDRLVFAAGSQLLMPDIPGLREFAYSIDQIDKAEKFETDCKRLALRAPVTMQSTIAVIGAGFTGIEIATELPVRLAALCGEHSIIRVILIERGSEIGPELGEDARVLVCEALAKAGVQCLLSAEVERLTGDGIVLSTGQFIDADMVLWAGGARANTLVRQIAGTFDELGRIMVTDDLSVADHQEIFVAGDSACARADERGNFTTMTCLHAITLGRQAGNNAAASLLGFPTASYRQEDYATCLDLGAWGAVFTTGRGHEVNLTGAAAKELKKRLNSEAIYPPPARRSEALAACGT
jgi:NADH dehydrogenase